MRKFLFSLNRVLAWRRTQARFEELKLSRLLADQQALESRRERLEVESASAVASLARGGPVTGSYLAALDQYRKSAAAQAGRLTDSIRDLEAQIAVQRDQVSGRRREVRLIERLREERFRAWRAEFSKDLERQAEESHRAHRGADDAQPR